MNLKAYDENNNPLFGRKCRNKEEARKAVVFNEYAPRIAYIIFKNKRYEIKGVYKW